MQVEVGLFYIDFAGSTDDVVVTRALGHLGEYALTLRVLGSYPMDTSEATK